MIDGRHTTTALRVERGASRRLVPCDECQTPVAELRADCLVIKSRHHNEWHVTVISFDQLRQWMDEVERVA